MGKLARVWAGVLAIASSSFASAAFADGKANDAEAAAESFFEVNVRPVLAGSCVKCHGKEKASGGLRLDSREAMLKGGESGPAIVPGKAGESLLAKAIRHDDEELKMPPNKPLAEADRDHLRRWIDAGAPWPAAAVARSIDAKGHWAFAALKRPAPPASALFPQADPVDRFIAKARSDRGLNAVAKADRRTLIRRATFDLTGLPPDPDRVRAFLADDRPDAFARLIDELLASPRYGERWGRYWLDLARYADTAGDNSDYPVPEAYLYRDYVIDAFNADIPYDRFLHEQIAGDILAPLGPADDYARRVIATGFLAQAKRFGTRKLEDIHQIIEDTLNTTGQTVLGLSLRCARCHDHKYDPVSNRDYYALYGFFSSTQFPFAGAEEDHKQSEFAYLVPRARVESLRSEHARRKNELKAEIDRVAAGDPVAARLRELDAAVSGLDAAIAQAGGPAAIALEGERRELLEERSIAASRLEALLEPHRERLAQLEKEDPLAGLPRAYAVGEATPEDARIQKGGDPRKKGDVVPRGVLTCLAPSGAIEIPQGASGRLQLAHWLTEGPPRSLAARVMANRVWRGHFGKGFVATPSDFGLRGAAPTHPEALDELAQGFIDSGWSIKALHKRIMLTEAYQLSSAEDSADAETDSGNAWYWRFDRRALDAEAIRDTILALGGDLDLSRPGPHPFPPKAKWRFTAHHQFKALYDSNHRSIYLMVQRLHPHPYLSLFNGPDTGVSTATRDESIVPLQSLFFLNGELTHKEAGGMAKRVVASAGDDAKRLVNAYRLAYARSPSADESARAGAFLRAYSERLAADNVAEAERKLEAWSALCRAILASNEFLFVD